MKVVYCDVDYGRPSDKGSTFVLLEGTELEHLYEFLRKPEGASPGTTQIVAKMVADLEPTVAKVRRT